MIFDRDDSSKDFVSIQTDTATLSPSDTKFAELKREISSANAKLDKLIDLMSKLSPKKIERKEE